MSDSGAIPSSAVPGADSGWPQDVDVDEEQGNGGQDPYDYISGYSAADDDGTSRMYKDGAGDIAFNPPSSPCNPQGHRVPPKPAQRLPSDPRSRHTSVAHLTHHQATQQPLPQSSALDYATLDLPNQNPPSHANRQRSVNLQSPPSRQASLQPPPTSRQGSVQPPPIREGSTQCHLPPSHQGSVQPPPSHEGSTQRRLPPSRQGSVQPHHPPSRQGSPQRHLPPSRQGSVQPHLAPSRQGSAQPQLHPSRQGSVWPYPQSHEGSVNPPPSTYDATDQYEPEDETSINERGDIGEEELQPELSRKRPYTRIDQSSGDEGFSEPQSPRVRRVPQIPVWTPQDTGNFAGPSTGTRSRVRQARPKIVTTDATPAPGTSSSSQVPALNLDVGMQVRKLDFLRPRALTKKGY